MTMTLTEARRRLPTSFNYTEARRAGLSDRKLYALRDAGEIIPLGGGLYRWSDAEPADLDLIEIAERAPKATMCLETALARHDLIDAIPLAIDIAIPRGATRPKLRARIRLHYFARATFDIGRETIDVGAKTPLGIYTPERCIIDMIRLRHQAGSDLAWEALRRWLPRRGSQPSQLLAMSRNFKGAESALQHALEVIL